jgi:NADH-quinone oxidoreductase subunit K
MLVEVLFYIFATILIAAALAVIISKNPCMRRSFLVLSFITSAAIWLLIEAEFLAIVLVLVYVGAVMVLFLFVVMMLDIKVEEHRRGFTRYAWLGWITAVVVIVEIVGVVTARRFGVDITRGATPFARLLQQHPGAGARSLYPVRLSLRACGSGAAGGHRGGDRAYDARAPRPQASGHQPPGQRAEHRPRAPRQIDERQETMITLAQLLALSGILFALAVAGVFINRKNVILLLMCVELLLLAANFNFIAFARYLGDIGGQVFVFFVLTVAAAESAIGLAILVVLFRERRTINVEDLDTLKG